MLATTTNDEEPMFWDKLAVLRTLYCDELIGLLASNRNVLPVHQLHQISVVIALLQTPDEHLQIPKNLSILLALESQVLLWLE